METSALNLVFVPILWGTFGGIVLGSVLLFLMRSLEKLLMYLGSASRSWEELSPVAHDPRPRHARPATGPAVRLHG
jgi:hypothetical protein